MAVAAQRGVESVTSMIYNAVYVQAYLSVKTLKRTLLFIIYQQQHESSQHSLAINAGAHFLLLIIISQGTVHYDTMYQQYQFCPLKQNERRL